ncbi:diguanylate cyclase [Myxococcota bacterium]|nr:diguanylate cyclase [Myxococcota bacterium]MBU1411154.1 diguanylate cyclase [Myxococcota bacterium]MBU1509728.1 diguanylate cyclase [Myxococcota bacterium]
MNVRALAGSGTGVKLGWSAFLITGIAGMLSLGLFRPQGERGLWVTLAGAALGVTLLGRVLTRLFLRPVRPDVIPEKTRFLAELEIVLLMVLSVSVFLQATGGAISPWHALSYWLMLVLAAFVRPSVSMLAAALLFGLEWMHARQGLPGVSARLLASHGLFLGLFGGTGLLVRTAEIVMSRRDERRRRTQKVRQDQEELRDFRLMGPVTARNERDRAEQDELLGKASLLEIHDHILYELRLLRESLQVTSAVLLWMDTAGQRLKVVEAASLSDAINGRFLESGVHFSALKGTIGNIVRNQLTMNIAPFPFAASALAYYSGNQPVGSFLGLPIFEQGRMIGVLCCDRADPTPFSEAQVTLAQKGAEQMLRTVATERVFSQMARSKFEQEKLYQALAYMNRALDLQSVVDAAFSAIGSICPLDEIAIVHWEDTEKKARILGAQGELFTGRVGELLSVNRSLLTLAMENRHFLPVNGELRDARQIVVHESISYADMNSVLVQPLIEGDRAIGGLVFASRERGVFTPQRRDMLGALANQVAIGLQKALMYQRLEEMATTDGLTGLTNHRTFQERFSQMLARAERSGAPLTMLITDIDKFKRVNDTYGHPIGDVVIKRVAAILKKQARNIDLVARYGGEEFGIVLEATDAEGARNAAERIRAEVEAQVFDSPQGQFKATLSIGFATFPADGAHKQVLIDKADKALYYAKEHGRNQVVYFGGI